MKKIKLLTTVTLVFISCVCFESCDNENKERQIASLEAQVFAYKDSLKSSRAAFKDSLKSSRAAFKEISQTMYKLSIERADILNRYCERLEMDDATYFKIGVLYNDNSIIELSKISRQEREDYRECQKSWNDLASRAKINLEN